MVLLLWQYGLIKEVVISQHRECFIDAISICSGYLPTDGRVVFVRGDVSMPVTNMNERYLLVMCHDLLPN